MRKKICFLFCALLFCTAVSSQTLRIRVFSQQQIKEAVFIPSFGHYSMEVSDKKVKLSKTTKVSVREQSAKVEVRIGDTLFASGEKVRFCAEGLKSFFCIKPLNPAVAERRYDDGLEISSDKKGNLLFINTVEQENYIAGVVQSETWGATKNIDFFKVQAVCCRNYLLRNIGKHSKDGYNLCDDVHCQAYKTRANHPEVTEGAYNSRGEVIVDENGELIETLFHSNSGGQTANASDVWGKEIPYLVSVIDSFSVGGKNYTWEKLIDKSSGKIRPNAEAAWNENWMDEISNDKAFMTEHILSVSGGSGKASYLYSMGYYKENGTLQNTDFDRLTMRLNGDVQATEWFKVGMSASLAHSKADFQEAVRKHRTYGTLPSSWALYIRSISRI